MINRSKPPLAWPANSIFFKGFSNGISRRRITDFALFCFPFGTAVIVVIVVVVVAVVVVAIGLSAELY
jgi:hypothetical protein